MSKIPFNKPPFLGNEFDYMREAIASGHISGDGAFTKRCNTMLEQLIGARKVLLTTSCTHALEMAALLLDIKPGDEVHFSIIYLRFHRERLCITRRGAGFRRYPPGYAQSG